MSKKQKNEKKKREKVHIPISVTKKEKNLTFGLLSGELIEEGKGDMSHEERGHFLRYSTLGNL